MEDRIQKLIEYKKLNSSQFAEEIGVQRSSISHILSGRNKPSLDLVLKILERFRDVDQNWLLFGKGKMLKEFDLFTTADTKASEKEVDLSDKETKGKDSKSEANKDNQSDQPDFIDIISKNLFSNSKDSPQTSNNLGIETMNYDTKKIPSNQDSDIEKIIILYKNGKFKDYNPF